MIDLVSKYLEFQEFNSQSGKTKEVAVRSRSSGVTLGWVKWYGPWRQYCLFAEPDTIWNTGCLDDIQGVIRELMEARRKD